MDQTMNKSIPAEEVKTKDFETMNQDKSCSDLHG